MAFGPSTWISVSNKGETGRDASEEAFVVGSDVRRYSRIELDETGIPDVVGRHW